MRVAIAGGRLAGLLWTTYRACYSPLPNALDQSVQHLTSKESDGHILRRLIRHLRGLAMSAAPHPVDLSESTQLQPWPSVIERYQSSFKKIPRQFSKALQTSSFSFMALVCEAPSLRDIPQQHCRFSMEEGVLSGKLTAQAISSCSNAPRVAADGFGSYPIQIAA